MSRRTPRWWPPTRAAVIYVIGMLGLYLITEGLAVFGDAALPVQDILGLIIVLALVPVVLVLLPLWFAVSIATGNSLFLGDDVPYMVEVMMAVAVLLNAVVVNLVARRRQRRRSRRLGSVA